MPTALDFAFAVLFVVVASAAEHFFIWPRFRADVAAQDAGARVRWYRRGIIGQWALAVAAAAIWVANDRSATALRLATPGGWRLGLGVAVVAAVLAFTWLQLSGVARVGDERRVQLRPKLGEFTFLLPHTRREHRWFLGLSVTAGICEELLYRGYLSWLLAPWLGMVGAFAASTALFGLGHAYQGRKGAVRATLVGGVLALVVLATNWLLPAMLVHALVDAGSGTVGFWLLRERGQSR